MALKTRPFSNHAVQTAFDALPATAKPTLLALRELIFSEAEADPRIGTLEETLKWGQPSYLTPQSKSGSTIRLGVSKTGIAALYAHCQTTIVSDFRSVFPDDFEYEGNRAVLLSEGPLASDKLALLVRSALTYHLK